MTDTDQDKQKSLKDGLGIALIVLSVVLLICRLTRKPKAKSAEGMLNYANNRDYGTFKWTDGMQAMPNDPREVAAAALVLPELKFNTSSMHDMEANVRNNARVENQEKDSRMRFTDARWSVDGEIAHVNSIGAKEGFNSTLDQSGRVLVESEVETPLKSALVREMPRSISSDVLRKVNFKPEYGRGKGTVSV